MHSTIYDVPLWQTSQNTNTKIIIWLAALWGFSSHVRGLWSIDHNSGMCLGCITSRKCFLQLLWNSTSFPCSCTFQTTASPCDINPLFGDLEITTSHHLHVHSIQDGTMRGTSKTTIMVHTQLQVHIHILSTSSTMHILGEGSKE